MFRQLVSVAAIFAVIVHVVLLSGTAAFALPLTEASVSGDSFRLGSLDSRDVLVARPGTDPLTCSCPGAGC
ncbi:hypothetical protein PM082_023908 [Marasmius tenuissimus]|nr:hypothetical protein PM082_023908 [Marasmius tenuissimus]